MQKLTAIDESGKPIDFQYGNHFFRQPCGDSFRLVISTSGSYVELLKRMARQFSVEQFYILYVLLLSHAGREPGRYQSSLLEDDTQLDHFLDTFQEFLEGDGRHHVWVGGPGSTDLLVYDQHDVVFAYGNLDRFEESLRSAGFQEQEFWFPVPHMHSYDPANSSVEEKLLQADDWKYFELQPGDEW